MGTAIAAAVNKQDPNCMLADCVLNRDLPLSTGPNSQATGSRVNGSGSKL